MTSTIKVNNIQNQCGTDIVKRCGATTTVGSGAGNTVVVCGSTVTIGRCGGTVALASGASQSGFGKTGAVDWQTTKKTATFTAASGEGYFCDTSSGAFTLNLPSSPSAGDIVGLRDYASTFTANNLTIGRGGSPLNGTTSDKALNTNNLSLTLIYVDATEGWIPVEEGTGFIGEGFIQATGGSISTSGNCRIHTFTGPGTFCVTSLACTAANNQVSYLVIAGGGAGGGDGDSGGGGGAGGFREDKSPVTPYTASPLDGAGDITVTAAAFPITVGGGGTAPGAQNRGGSGSNSVFSTITSAGGGGGGAGPAGPGCAPGGNGGSGGGGGNENCTGRPGGSGNTPPVSPSQGNGGGNGRGNNNPLPGQRYAGGGGGAICGGTSSLTNASGSGGAGATTHITGSPVQYAGGGGGGAHASGNDNTPPTNGGAGGGGAGGNDGQAAVAGTDNRGGGGGGGKSAPGSPAVAANGGSGIVVIRYKFQ